MVAIVDDETDAEVGFCVGFWLELCSFSTSSSDSSTFFCVSSSSAAVSAPGFATAASAAVDTLSKLAIRAANPELIAPTAPAAIICFLLARNNRQQVHTNLL